jgi:hypothetical protein
MKVLIFHGNFRQLILLLCLSNPVPFHILCLNQISMLGARSVEFNLSSKHLFNLANHDGA